MHDQTLAALREVDWIDPSDGDAGRVLLKIGRFTLVSGVDITPAESGVTVLVGANNVGKSTVLNALHDSLRDVEYDSTRAIPRVLTGRELLYQHDAADLIQFLAQHGKLQRSPFGEVGFARKGNVFYEGSIRVASEGGRNAGEIIYQQLVYVATPRQRLNAQLSVQARALVNDPPLEPLHRLQDDRSLFASVSSLSERVFGTPLYLDDLSGATISIRLGRVSLPLPPRDQPLGDYGDALRELPLLEQQGDGMVSFFSLIIPLVADHYSTVLIDEPEAFLHPPQARALGNALATIARERSTQVIVATHDKDFIAGLLTAGVPVTVVRILRNGDTTSGVQLAPERLRQVWDDRALRYSNVLDGLFSKLVVIAEGGQDCRFYEAALDSHAELTRAAGVEVLLPPDDVLFVPSFGKQGVLSVLRVLRDLQVPVATVLDIDALDDESAPLLQQLVEDAGGAWETLGRLRRIAVSGITTKEQWKHAKKSGDRAFSGEQRGALDELIVELDRLGVFLVRVGELEGFAPRHKKDHQWLPSALHAGAHASAEARAFVTRLLDFHAVSSTRS